MSVNHLSEYLPKVFSSSALSFKSCSSLCCFGSILRAKRVFASERLFLASARETSGKQPKLMLFLFLVIG
ncbi:Uncharacterised protein [Vibrio cholerae]|nr:Uncharacterised protein [Vibrio cholerae]